MTDVRSPRGEDTANGSDEAGVRRVLQLIARLSRRPHGKDSTLPMICLVRQPQNDQFLKLLNDRLSRTTPRQIPHARVDAAAYKIDDPADDEAATQAIRQLLHSLCEKFSVSRFGFARLRFRHILLVEWLMDQEPPQVSPMDRGRELARKLRGNPGHWGEDLLNQASQQVGPIERLLLGLLKLVIPPILFRARISGRIPGIGRDFRWFLRQQYLAPRQSGSFIGFAERLTKPARDDENPEQIRKLLVHSFLEDLRRGYERGLWRTRGWRRTAYALALIDNVAADNAGQALLELVNDVRNESGRSDPLLIVAACATVPPDAVGQRVTPMADIDDDTFPRWEEGVPQSRRRQEKSTWYLPLIAMPVSAPEAVRQVPLVSLVPGRVPWWVSGGFVAALCLVLVAGLTGAATIEVKNHWNCFGGVFGDRVSVRLHGDDCIGFSDSENYVFPSDQRLSQVQSRVFAQNRKAENLHVQRPDRPYFTLVYLGQLTSSSDASFDAESEDLEGIAAAQRELLDANYNPLAPLMRIIVANAGPQVRYGAETLAMLKPVVQDDPSIIGMIGLDESRTDMVNVIQNLNGLGLPVIATSLSADNLYRTSPLYFQIAPPNHEQADMIAAVVANPDLLNDAPPTARIARDGRAYIYYNKDENDLYTKTLADDLARSIGAPKVAYLGNWSNVSAMCQEQPRATAIFAGRSAEFDDFIKRVVDTCGDNQPAVIADDSVNRFMASDRLRKQPSYNRPLIYVAKSALVTCATKDDSNQDSHRNRSSFHDLITKDTEWHPCVKPTDHPFGERTALTYDATTAFLRAVDSLLPNPQSGATVTQWQQRLPITPSTTWARLRGLAPFDGVTGVIDFTSNTDSTTGYESKNKRQALLGVEEISDVNTAAQVLFACGTAATSELTDNDKESPGCPPRAK